MCLLDCISYSTRPGIFFVTKWRRAMRCSSTTVTPRSRASVLFVRYRKTQRHIYYIPPLMMLYKGERGHYWSHSVGRLVDLLSVYIFDITRSPYLFGHWNENKIQCIYMFSTSSVEVQDNFYSYWSRLYRVMFPWTLCQSSGCGIISHILW